MRGTVIIVDLDRLFIAVKITDERLPLMMKTACLKGTGFNANVLLQSGYRVRWGALHCPSR